jgi:hypothetical protein
MNLLSGDSSSSVARNARSDRAICGQHAAEPAESVSGPATLAAESTTVAFHGLEVLRADSRGAICQRNQHRIQQRESGERLS